MADTKKRNQLIVLGALLFVAVMVWYFYFGRSRAIAGSAKISPTTYAPINAQDYETVFEKLKVAEATEYKTAGRNIFVAGPVAPVVDPNQPVTAEVPKYQPTGPQPPPPPPPAQLSMKFYGYGTLPSNGARKAFLLDGEEVRIVGEGEVVQNHIRITHIGNDRIEFEDTNTGQRGSNALELIPAA